MGNQAVYAGTLPQIPMAWRKQFIRRRIFSISQDSDANFIIYTGSVLPDSIIQFVTDVFPRLGSQSRLTVIYDKEADAQKIRSELRATEFWTRISYQRVVDGLQASLTNAYQQYRQEGAVVVAPSVSDFSVVIPGYRRLIFNSALTEAGVPDLAEDILTQMGVSLAGLPLHLKPEEIEREIARLKTIWSQKGFAGVRFDQGIIPDISLYLQYVAEQAQLQTQSQTYA